MKQRHFAQFCFLHHHLNVMELTPTRNPGNADRRDGMCQQGMKEEFVQKPILFNKKNEGRTNMINCLQQTAVIDQDAWNTIVQFSKINEQSQAHCSQALYIIVNREHRSLQYQRLNKKNK